MIQQQLPFSLGKTQSGIDQDDCYKQLELIPTKVFSQSKDACVYVANEIANLIQEKQKNNQTCVLGLATGSTPIGVYANLVRMHRENKLSFKNVVTFNLDEYYPISKSHQRSYHTFMHENLFNHVDIPSENIHIPDGELPKEKVYGFCQDYEKLINQFGGIDLQILGIGKTGHVGFNEPGSSRNSVTRMINLDKITRSDAQSDFFSLKYVPKQAITMGISTIINAKRIVIMAWSETKASIVKKAIEGPVSSQVPATYLQGHPSAQFILDKPAASQLARYKQPWLIHGVTQDPLIKYDDYLTKKAVIWLAQKVKKPILRLVDIDYEEQGLLELLCKSQKGSGEINLKVFHMLEKVITGWPAGGKPQDETDNIAYFNKKSESKKRILIFSPHSDDDVTCMGATMSKLIKQGHEIHTAYMSSGNLAVYDHDAYRYTEFVKEFAKKFQLSNQEEINKICDTLQQKIATKKEDEYDDPQVRSVKTIVRTTESVSAALSLGIPYQNINSLLLPFYETGVIKKKSISEADVKPVSDLIRKVKPDYIYAAGDLTDPHGTHRICLDIFLQAIQNLQMEDSALLQNCQILFYRGAWQEWDLEDVSMAVPMSPEEVIEKRMTIFKHQSQKDVPMFPGADPREFWQRAEDRNKATAELFKELGFHQYEGVECFVTLNTLKQQLNL